MYERKRGALYAALTRAGLECTKPDGAYYIVAEIGELGFKDDFAAADFLLDEVGSRGGARFELLPSRRIGASEDSIHVFEKRRDDRGGSRASGASCRKSWRGG